MSEFVLSNELVSMALAMVAENPDVNDILSELFTPDGNELYVHPASRYLRCAQPQQSIVVTPREVTQSASLLPLSYCHLCPSLGGSNISSPSLSLVCPL